MRGKTSFLNALRWALYGEALDRFGKPMARARLVNSDSSAAGDWTMSVELKFKVDAADYDLTRAIQPKDPDIKPHLDSDFAEKLFVRRNGHFLNAEESQ